MSSSEVIRQLTEELAQVKKRGKLSGFMDTQFAMFQPFGSTLMECAGAKVGLPFPAGQKRIQDILNNVSGFEYALLTECNCVSSKESISQYVEVLRRLIDLGVFDDDVLSIPPVVPPQFPQFTPFTNPPPRPLNDETAARACGGEEKPYSGTPINFGAIECEPYFTGALTTPDAEAEKGNNETRENSSDVTE